ncbi:MAG: CNNM domain-containing protein [Enhygromyxa sp.]
MGLAAILLIVYVSLALGISFLCSVLEAALLSVRDMELSRRADDGDAAAKRLLSIRRNRTDDAISAILTLNTIAHTVGATMAGAQAAVVFGDEMVGVFSGVLTLLVLVVTEIIPKTIGTVYASRLVGFVGATISVLMTLLSIVLFFTRLLTRLFVKHKHEATISRRDVLSMIALARSQGNLDEDVTATLANVLKLDEIRVSDVMTPRTVTRMLPHDATVKDLLESKDHAAFSRIPLYRDTYDQIEGYVLVREVFAEAARTGDTSLRLAEYLRPIRTMPEDTKLSDLLERLLEWREHAAMVVDQFGGTQGLVTLEDVLETVLGREILDEVDTVADLRHLAKELRDRRAARRVAASASP